MKRLTYTLLTLCLLAFLTACGSDSTNPNAIVQTGSNSLIVNADVDASDQGGGQFQTDFSVILQDSLSAVVTDALVNMWHSAIGSIQLTHDTLNPGTYNASRNTYTQGTYSLTISRGTDIVANVFVVAPDLHTITFPTTSDTLAVNTAFTVLYNRLVAADIVEVETRDWGPTLSTSVGETDDGSFVVAASNTTRDDQRVRVWRRNSTDITVAWSASTFDARIRNSVSPIVVQ